MAEFDWDWEADVLQNLNRFLGIDLKFILGIPDYLVAGDRVLCLLKGGAKAAQELSERIAARSKIGWDSGRPTGYPHVALLDNLPSEGPPTAKVSLRVTDLLGDLCFWRGQRRYLQSTSPLAEAEKDVRWLLGAIFLAERRVIAYADLRHTKVKLVFTESFFVSGDSSETQSKRASRLLERLQGALTLKNRYIRNEAYQWAKIVNACDGPQWVALMDLENKLSIEEIPYPES